MDAMYSMNAHNALAGMNAEYAQLTDALRWQQQRIIELEAETRDLRRQLDDLRRGVGLSVIVDGHQIPVAPLATPAAPAAPHPGRPPARDSAWLTGAHPVVAPSATHTPAPQASNTTGAPQPWHGYMAPSPVSAAPPSALQPMPHAPAAFPENAWLTGPAPAMQANNQPVPHERSLRPAPRHVAAPQPQRPHRYMPPTWLREEAPTVASWDDDWDAHSSASPLPPSEPQYRTPTPRAADPASMRQSDQRQTFGRFPTLAQMTGQHPAVRVPGKKKLDGERSPFTDSFVLG